MANGTELASGDHRGRGTSTLLFPIRTRSSASSSEFSALSNGTIEAGSAAETGTCATKLVHKREKSVAAG